MMTYYKPRTHTSTNSYRRYSDMYFSHSEIKTFRLDNKCGVITKNYRQDDEDGFWYTESVEVWVFDYGSESLTVERREGESWRQAAIRVGKEAKRLAEDMCNKAIEKQSADDPNPCEEDKRTIEEWADEMERDQESYEQYIAEFAESQSMGVDTETLNYSYCSNTSRYIDL